jgi:hypothetical protein
MDEANSPTTELGDGRRESPARRLLIFLSAIAILLANFLVIDLSGRLRV